MHELIANDWLDHDYIARHTLGWPALRERALQWPPERAAAVCGIDAPSRCARWRATTARPAPAAIRLNYGMQRVRGGGNAARADRLPAVPGRRLAPSRRRHAAVELGLVPRCDNARRCSGPTCSARPPAAHHQHEHDRRRPAARRERSPTARSGRRSRRWSSTTATRSRWRRSRRKVVRGLRARGPVHRRARALP